MSQSVDSMNDKNPKHKMKSQQISAGHCKAVIKNKKKTEVLVIMYHRSRDAFAIRDLLFTI